MSLLDSPIDESDNLLVDKLCKLLKDYRAMQDILVYYNIIYWLTIFRIK